MKLTPIHLKVLMYYFETPGPYPSNSQEVTDCTIALARHALIEPQPEGYFRCTDRGLAHVKQILNLPLPQQVWTDAQGKPIK